MARKSRRGKKSTKGQAAVKEEAEIKQESSEEDEPQTDVETDEAPEAGSETAPDVEDAYDEADDREYPVEDESSAEDEEPSSSPAVKADYLFNVSSFVMTVFSIFVIFGAFIIVKRLTGHSAALYARNAFVTNAMFLGILCLEMAILMKLYAVLIRFRVQPLQTRLPDTRADWFLKVATFTFVTAAAVRVIAAIVRARRWYVISRVASYKVVGALRYEADALISQSFGLASFFLLMAIFSLVYLLHTKYSRLTGLEEYTE